MNLVCAELSFGSVELEMDSVEPENSCSDAWCPKECLGSAFLVVFGVVGSSAHSILESFAHSIPQGHLRTQSWSHSRIQSRKCPPQQRVWGLGFGFGVGLHHFRFLGLGFRLLGLALGFRLLGLARITLGFRLL